MKYPYLVISVWIGYFLLNIVLAEWNDTLRRKNITIHHGWWALMYAGLVGLSYLFFKDWYLIGSITLLHLSIFPVAFNRFSGNPAFHLSVTTTAITDILMRKIGFKTTFWINVSAFGLSIFFLIKSLKPEL